MLASTDVLKYCCICKKLETDQIWFCDNCEEWYHNHCGTQRKNANVNSQPKCKCQERLKPMGNKRAKKSKK